MQFQSSMAATSWRASPAEAPIRPPSARRGRLVLAYGVLGLVSALGLLISSEDRLAERWDEAQVAVQRWWQQQVGLPDATLRADLPPPSDAKLAAHLQRALSTEPEFAAQTVALSVESGVVTLRGEVAHPALRERLERRVLAMPGVRALHDQIGVTQPQMQVSALPGPPAEP